MILRPGKSIFVSEYAAREAKKNGEILNSKENAGQDASYEREILGFASEYLERMGQ